MNNPSFSAHKNPHFPVILFTVALFCSAGLMFVLQPLFGKLLLPLLGGAPAVWNTCMVFYQTLLFLGYLYAHAVSLKLPLRRQILLHAGLLACSLIALPVALPADAAPGADAAPVWWLLRTLLVAIGLPFFVVSTTAPLLQKWFSRCGHAQSGDPYFLYAASNAGSLLALLSYPFLIEPNLGLQAQRQDWSVGYLLLCGLILACGAWLWRGGAAAAEPEAVAEDAPEPRRQWHWLALAFVPSSLLLGFTQYISTDIAAVPLLWLGPLVLYLLSFIVVFSRLERWCYQPALTAQPALLIVFLAYSFINPALLPYWLDLILHGAAFFLACLVCHGELARLRPPASQLTRYYLLMSAGGMLGGLFNTFAAPFLFNAVYEYPIMIVASLALRPGFFSPGWGWRLLFPGLLLAAGLILYAASDDLLEYLDVIGGGLILLAGLSYSFRISPAGLAGVTAVLLLFTFGLHSLASSTLYQKRTFFGVLSVRDTVIPDENGKPETVRELYHGTTKHGAERLIASQITTPLTYYSRPGPIGQLFAEYDAEDAQWRVGAVGLGAGALACYAKPGQQWRFYEIDPLVVEVAKNPHWFNYLNRCDNRAEMLVGDARLSLQKEPDASFDLLVLDAFSSDAVPVHLLTREALELYFSKLKPNGLLAFHITNRHLELKQVLADHANHLHLAGLLQEFKPDSAVPLVVATDWVAMSREPERISRLERSRLGHWQKLPLVFGFKPWTDDFSNIFGIWKQKEG